jgi:hypothetical protein
MDTQAQLAPPDVTRALTRLTITLSFENFNVGKRRQEEAR